VIEADDLRCPVCSLACPIPAAEGRPGTVVEILRCTGCGAAMTYEVATRAASCAFCGSVLSVEHPDDPVEAAERSLPFTVDRDGASAAVRDWLGTLGWFRPGDLRSAATLETVQPLRWVAWVFDAEATVSWTADTDAGAQRSDWAPHAGVAELDYDDVVVPATRGLEPEEAAHLLPSYDLTGSVAEDVVDDATIECFDVPRSTGRARLIDAVERLARGRLIERHLPGRRHRNLATATVLRGLHSRRIAFPAWVLAYRYRNRLYRTVLSGQNASRLTGEAPVSALRIAAAVAAAALLVAAVALAALL
jgi:hypothetical protein